MKIDLSDDELVLIFKSLKDLAKKTQDTSEKQKMMDLGTYLINQVIKDV